MDCSPDENWFKSPQLYNPFLVLDNCEGITLHYDLTKNNKLRFNAIAIQHRQGHLWWLALNVFKLHATWCFTSRIRNTRTWSSSRLDLGVNPGLDLNLDPNLNLIQFQILEPKSIVLRWNCSASDSTNIVIVILFDCHFEVKSQGLMTLRFRAMQ